jgi:hypothetical protein
MPKGKRRPDKSIMIAPIPHHMMPPIVHTNPQTIPTIEAKIPKILTAEQSPKIAERIKKGIEKIDKTNVLIKDTMSIIYFPLYYIPLNINPYRFCFCFSSNSLILMRDLHRGQHAYHLLFPL